ncbi:UNVERIFIED_CONTAM: hypothetical protein Slati_2221200 [Sesamum latifolium]|uniref:Reverse transcriptase domain-containing protein n=1 Tax=Sesamum latifolium TaxID=2727402 RepID=A0AAW2WTL9_9LAMI
MLVRGVWRHHIYGTKIYGVVCKFKALKTTFRAQRKIKGDLSNNVCLAKEFLEKAQGLFDMFKEDILLQLVQWCRAIYCKAVKLEASMLQQRAKLNWFKHGDQCSKIFFRKINAKRAKQRVYQISNSVGDILTEADQVVAEFLSFFQSLLRGLRQRRSLNFDFLQPHLKHTLTIEEANELLLPVTQAEIKEAFFDISKDSAPGPDGYTSAFFKAAWPEIGNDICAAVTEFFVSGRLLKQLNATLLVLIPKVQLPVRVSEFRPIACCNVVYKAISKILVRRMQRVLHMLIDYSQNAFVPDGSIADNVLLAQELLAGYNLVRLLQRCTIDSVHTIKSTLAEFAEMSGLHVNPNKNTIILSKAVQRDRQGILALMEFQKGFLPIKYLGVPLIALRLTVADCQPLIDRITSRLAGWTHLNLSLAGCTQLLKSVLSSLHMYWASVFILPKAVIKVIEGKMRAFLWKGSSGTGYAKVSWVQVCKSKEEGGLGIRRVLHMNQALMLKHVWRILQEDPRSIWVAWVLRHRLQNQTIWTYNSASASWRWRKLIKISLLLKDGLEYRVARLQIQTLD